MSSNLAPTPRSVSPKRSARFLPIREARKLRKLMDSGYNSALLGAALRLTGTYPEAELPRMILARSFLKDRKTAHALCQLEAAAANSAASPELLELYAKTLDAHGEPANALSALTRLCDRFPEAATAQVLTHKATLHLRLGDRLGARLTAAQAAAKDGGSTLALEVFSSALRADDRLEQNVEKDILFQVIASYSANTATAQAMACDLVFQEIDALCEAADGDLVFPANVLARLTILLANGVVCHLGLEAVARALRQAVLGMVSSNRALSPADQAVAEALATHSFANEFLWPEHPEETASVLQLERRVIDALNAGQSVDRDAVFTLGAYRDLSQIEAVGQWVAAQAANAARRSEAFDPTLRKIALEPLIEAQLAANMPVLTEVEDATSGAVRAQYEKNPYPRWSSLPKKTAQPYLQRISAQIDPAPLDLDEGSKSPRVLVAGCGTGQHPISVALEYEGAQVMAVDLSRASLAYGAREAHARSVANIVFAQGDILKLGAMGPAFDVVEAIGVLHHMARPEDGLKALLETLKPGGLLHLGLYSEIARKDITDARVRIVQDGFGPGLEGIRAFRSAYLENQEGIAGDLTQLRDFYTTSELRDLVFHVQEHQFTVPGLADLLACHGLDFLGFADLPDEVRAKYSAQFAEDEAQTDLANWHVFETENPSTFRCMYRLWCRKPA